MSPFQILDFLFNLYISIVLLRFLLQLVHADFYNPLSQFVVRMTQPVLGPLRKLIPSHRSFDFAALLFAFVLFAAKLVVMVSIAGGSVNIGMLLHTCVFGLTLLFLQLLFWCVLVRALLSWVDPYGAQPVSRVLIQISEPMLRPIRRLIPAMGGIDLSPLFLILLISLAQWGVGRLSVLGFGY